MPSSTRPRVVILGAGFGGLGAAKALAGKADVTLVDRHNFQTFLPLLYQVSTAGLAADHVVHPVRGALRDTGVKFRMGSPISVDHKNKTVKLDSSETLEFDHLIVALGSSTADFGVPGVSEHGLGMKSVHEALMIRAEVMRRFEDLCRFEDNTRLSIAVVGGGPTGVEMAGALAELKRGPLKNDLAHAADHMDIYLIEAGPRILPMFSEKLSARAESDLHKLGVFVKTNTSVREIKSRQIIVKTGEPIPAEVTIWAAGVKGEPTAGLLNLPIAGTRIDTDENLEVNHYPNIWAIGDINGSKGKDGRFYPMVAPVALQQGKWVAQQILRKHEGKALKPFKYRDKGSMATIGRHKAVVEVRNFRMTGPLAWFAWLFLHLFYLLGGRNKIGTIADWTWNYLTFDRGNRHIMDTL
ncbi:NADH dehydrogenase [Candidatus Planktophila dulcis]|jgi:NADH dehydrogenase|uniref:NADH:ubiquinone reductase (non-electrogenic) n=1 Tax=Candidatus Planktophila dulcis TaxID=1884914 RepID=A0AAC9YS56_9ACTN|nr:NAD(P)/FAD-dependent oxidoreductase [Candidatus Planktophila dulcis]ASY11491.1 NADH dehydrogenase [Candidatus Planktophila dulcis]